MTLKSLSLSQKLFATLILLSMAAGFSLAGLQAYVHQIRYDKDLFVYLNEPASGEGRLFAHEKHNEAAEPEEASQNAMQPPIEDSEASYSGEALEEEAWEEDFGLPEETLLDDRDFQWLLKFTHIHSFSMSFIFIFTGGVFLFSGFSEKAKCFWILMPFLGIAVDLASQWLRMYSAEAWGLGSYLGGSMMGAAFMIQCVVSLRELWFAKAQ